MIGFSIIIMGKDDTTGFGLDPKVTREGQIKQAAIIENGMQSGKDSIAFDILTPEGTHLVVQTSVALLDTLLAAARGASQRWRGDGQ